MSENEKKPERKFGLAIAFIIFILGAFTGAMIVNYPMWTETNTVNVTTTTTVQDLSAKTLAVFFVSAYQANHTISQNGFTFNYVAGVNGSGALTYVDSSKKDVCGNPVGLIIYGEMEHDFSFGYIPYAFDNRTYYSLNDVSANYQQSFVVPAVNGVPFSQGDQLAIDFHYLSNQTNTLREAYEPILLVFIEAPNLTACH